MSFTTRFQNSWQLLLRTLSVLKQHPRLLLFPVISTACSLVIVVFFFGALALDFTLNPSLWALATPGKNAAVNVHYNLYAESPILVGLYFLSMFLATFMNVALYNEIMRALRGEKVSIAGGLRFARSRIYSIFLWSLFASFVGWVIRSLSQRFGFIGRIVVNMIGVAWSVATVFVTPIIIRDPNPNPLEMLRNSAATLKKTWGESLIGYVGIKLGDSLIGVASLVFLISAGALSFALGQWLVFASAFLVWILAMIVLSVVMSVAGSIYRCALYMYATEGVVPEPYTQDLMDLAWKVKK